MTFQHGRSSSEVQAAARGRPPGHDPTVCDKFRRSHQCPRMELVQPDRQQVGEGSRHRRRIPVHHSRSHHARGEDGPVCTAAEKRHDGHRVLFRQHHSLSQYNNLQSKVFRHQQNHR